MFPYLFIFYFKALLVSCTANYINFHVTYIAGRKINFFPGSHLAPKYFKVVANSKKLVAIMTHTYKKHFPCFD